MLPAPRLGLTGASIYVKYENLQVANSFRARRAQQAGVADEVGAPGVIAMSAGNHAQAVAYHAERLGIL